MAGLVGVRPAEVFRAFQQHIAGLLNRTVTDAPLSLTHKQNHSFAAVTFRDEQKVAIAAPLFGSSLFLFFSQDLIVEDLGNKTLKLRTVKYAYHLLEAPSPDSPCVVRWEYISPSRRKMTHPRNHVHLPIILETSDGPLDLDTLHLPTGWVTIEEVIRFLIVEVGIKPKSDDWNADLESSEKLFKQWTGREIEASA